MVLSIRRLLAVGLSIFALLAVVSGCGGPTGSHQYKDGRLYFLNNCRPPRPEDPHTYIQGFWVEYEGVKYYPPFHLTWDGQPTGEGAMELTDYPLPGGTKVTVKYYFDHMNGFVESRTAETVIDGNITIEAYMQDWATGGGYGSTVLHRVHPGKWEGITILGTDDPSAY